MSDNVKQGLIKKQILTESEVTEIERLARICNNHENLHMRIGWIRLRPQQREETNNFLFNDFLFFLRFRLDFVYFFLNSFFFKFV